MNLYKSWIRLAYDAQGETDKKFWNSYTPIETQIYEDLLSDKSGAVNMPLTEFAKKYKLKPEYVVGFLDGINGALDEEIDPDSIDLDYVIDIKFDYERLFRKMVEYKAKHLYHLPGWSAFFSDEEREGIIDEQRRAGTFVADEKPGRNEPCSCGSGKKYKKCCGIAS